MDEIKTKSAGEAIQMHVSEWAHPFSSFDTVGGGVYVMTLQMDCVRLCIVIISKANIIKVLDALFALAVRFDQG